MAALLPNVDPEGLLEYSVVFSDRSLNHMSAAFQDVMRDISATLRRAYNLGEDAGGVAVVPGGRSEEHTSELQSLMRISYAVFCLKKKNKKTKQCVRRTSTEITESIMT